MERLRGFLFAGIIWVVAGVGAARADNAPPDPLRLVPAESNFVAVIPRPRQVVESYTASTLIEQLQALAPVREFMDSTSVRRFRQLLAYFEKQLGARWPEALDQISGGGIVVAARVGPNPAPALVVFQGTDPAAVQKFARVGLAVVEQELARGDGKERLRKSTYRDHDTYHVGAEFHAAIAGSAILVSNKEEVLHLALDLGGPAKGVGSKDAPTEPQAGGKGSVCGLAEVADLVAARRQLPANPLTWVWLNLDAAHKSPEGKELFALPRNDPNVTILFGGLFDVIGRSPYVCAALERDKDDLNLTVRMPRGREGMHQALRVHVPPAGSGPGLPPLKPHSTLYSTRFYFDLAQVWEQRAALFNAKQVKAFEDFDNTSALYLLGNRFSKLVAQTGTDYRVVVVNQPTTGYTRQPEQRIPAFAVVVSLREPEKFEKQISPVLRGAALLARTQVKLTLVEEKIGDLTLVGYRFSENEPQKGDDDYTRLNYSPAFIRVGDQFVASSTIELARELAKMLVTEQKVLESRKKDASRQVSLKEESRFYADGLVDALRVNEDQLIAQTILNQALSPALAKEQVDLGIALVKRLGMLQTETHYGDADFRISVRLKTVAEPRK